MLSAVDRYNITFSADTSLDVFIYHADLNALILLMKQNSFYLSLVVKVEFISNSYSQILFSV